MLEFMTFLGKMFYDFYMTFNVKFLDMPVGFLDLIIAAFVLGVIFSSINYRKRDDL